MNAAPEDAGPQTKANVQNDPNLAEVSLSLWVQAVRSDSVSATRAL